MLSCPLVFQTNAGSSKAYIRYGGMKNAYHTKFKGCVPYLQGKLHSKNYKNGDSYTAQKITRLHLFINFILFLSHSFINGNTF
jgi:hypothetical protein